MRVVQIPIALQGRRKSGLVTFTEVDLLQDQQPAG